MSIGLSDAGCSPRDVTVPAGKVTFQVGNPNSSVVQTFEVRQANELLGRVTNIVGGLSRNLEVELEEGTYLIACSGAGKGGSGTLTVTGLER